MGGHVPALHPSRARVLGLWSFGMVLARSCALPAVSLQLAVLLGRKENTVRQQLREGVYEAAAKRGKQRRELVVRPWFAPLLRWVLSWWEGQQLALALDATSLGDRFVVLVVSVLDRGCASPVRWTVRPAGRKHAWRGEWLRLLRELRPAVPPGWTVIVLADRGLYAPWLFRRIVRLGWHPCLRVKGSGTFRPACGRALVPFRSLVPTVGSEWSGTGIAFKTRGCQLPCTLLGRWEEGSTDPWLILTDLPPAVADACWYGLRAWIEQGFTLRGRGGFPWQRTRMTDPDRAARRWLGVALATLWLLSVGGEAEEAIPPRTLGDRAAMLSQGRRQRRATQMRRVSVIRRGWVTILAALINGRPLPLGCFRPESWPASAGRSLVHTPATTAEAACHDIPTPESPTPSLKG